MNTIVVVNQNSPDSCELGNHLNELRSIPPENTLRISWSGNPVSWSSEDFTNTLLNPVTTMLTARGLANQIDYVVLSMGIPFQTILNATNVNSTTSVLFYGLKTDGGTDLSVTNSFAASESVFRQARPASAPGISFLTTMITAESLASAKRIVNQGAASDNTLPLQPVLLGKTTDPARNIRHLMFDNTMFNARVLGKSSILRINSDDPSGQAGLFGYQTGLMRYQVSPGTFIPGAMADSLTSYGGVIFGPNDQTNLLAFIEAGAAGSYGTVAEPLADFEKFPNPQVYFYQARGFCMAECYYLGIARPYLGLTVAEPLAAPFALPGTGTWGSGLSNSLMTGNPPLTVNFSEHDATRPLTQIDLFVNGKFHITITNLLPRPNNILSVALNGYPISYTVPTNATISSIASNLTALINNPAATNSTKIRAFHWGDRIELQSIATNHSSFPFYTTDSSSLIQSGAVYRVQYLPASLPPRIIPNNPDSSGRYRMQMEIPTALNYVIQASTNLANWLPIFTNTTPGLLDFRDSDSTNYARRFYRIAGPVPDQPPRLSATTATNGATFRVRMESQAGQPAAILVSTNLLVWTPVGTNQAGGVIEWDDTNASSFPGRFYRAWLPPGPLPTLSATSNASQPTLIRVENPIQPYVVESSTNGTAWMGLITNFLFHEIQAAATTDTGGADICSTFLNFSRPTFATSEAHGMLEYKIPVNIPISTGAWIQLTITKTNGQVVILGLTNQIAGISATNIAAQLVAMVNANTYLQGSDGLTADDFSFNPSFATFYLRARSPGYQAAGIRVYAQRSGSLIIIPGDNSYLTQNLSDLQPRNHLYVTAGAHQISANFALDTTQLPDGCHELTAVAYEGSNVRTQTRTTIPVCISNSPLSATLTLLDLTNNAPAQATYHIQVSANTNNVSLTTLYSTGGAIGFAAKNQNATFDVIGTNLCAGLHPFYAIVETFSGQKYRTQTSWIRLQ
ncbi:MAG: TIGR03790 family protein [Verrucomicrobia bacterium]|nr:TIGR03790 family protein [Verrucomicrobiota bacterium]